ncbi:MAG: sigma 54-interacting transcriptional regulator [Clostridium sp.]|nr:sigma 54-interacting transcriptional regulator [Clostridium sp.]
MTSVLLVVPYEELQERFEACVAQQDTQDIQVDICHLWGSRFSDIDFDQYHVIAARGITGYSIREHHPKVAFVEISVTSDDILNTLSKAVDLFGRQRMAVVLPDSVRCNMEQITRLSGMELEIFYIHNEEDAEQTVDAIQRENIHYVIGGLTIYSECRKRGITALPFETAAETVHRTVDIALETARSINRARVKSHLMRTVLDNHHDGVLACDLRGIVVAANTQACYHLTNGNAAVSEIINRPIDELLPDSGWREVLGSGVAQDTMREFNGLTAIMRCAPMSMDGQRTGLFFTIQTARAVQDTDSRIRREMKQKGFTAQYTFNDILVKDAQMQQRLILAYKYAKTDANVLILGETGTGKELFAQSIHNASPRSQYPFVAVNCAALPEHLLESELFGYSEGAFTGAKKGGKEGLFELAHKGTIFLDEIGEMPINLQAKLLRVLQEKELRRIGDNKIIPVDVRIISATNITIRRKILEGEFRSDLYYRINLLEMQLPPLRERPDDIEWIFMNLLEQHCRAHAQPVPHVSPEVLAQVRSYPWYGNVRELRNFSERLIILSEGSEITLEQLELTGLVDAAAEKDDGHAERSGPAQPYKRKEDIAREMGISRTTLWRRSRKMKQNET